MEQSTQRGPGDLPSWLHALSQIVLTQEADRERAVTRQEALDWLSCPPAVFDALVAGGLPEVAPDPYTGATRYDYHDVVNVGLAAGSGVSTGELSERMLLRYAASAPDTWLAPRAWTVESSYICGHGDACTGGGWEVADSALEQFGGRLDIDRVVPHAAGDGVTLQVQATAAGSLRVVASDVIRTAYSEVLDDLRHGSRRYQWLPGRLRTDPARARLLGVTDCLVTSVELADRLAAQGFEARTRTVTALGYSSVDHAWAEVLDLDGEWKFLDPLFAHLASRWSRTREEYEQFCCGSMSNRLLPWHASAMSGVARHRCAGAPAGITSTISTGVTFDHVST